MYKIKLLGSFMLCSFDISTEASAPAVLSLILYPFSGSIIHLFLSVVTSITELIANNKLLTTIDFKGQGTSIVCNELLASCLQICRQFVAYNHCRPESCLVYGAFRQWTGLQIKYKKTTVSYAICLI